MEKKIFEIIKSVMGTDFSHEDRDKRLNTFSGWDSFNNLMLISELQTEYNVEFSAMEIDGVHTLNDLLKLVKKKAGK